ncbi:hypothetical protein FUA23_12410 [Neolewinella aurantiaca]|uniref:Uncharacterized protein n=1 Tax=Neolewinella aurantiaca TaxID=2602767 RepID=A0A5C7FH53_9BACT|nr:hypothetical protein [Neolewinella aurantiaca]TXF89083.1 hypothetical protein FUA23_12410 [Neolewinella aurantiaca]
MNRSSIYRNKRLAGIALSALLLLLVPLVAMQFTEEVNWSAGDFLAMGVLLSALVIAVEVVLRTVRQPKHRLFLCLGILVTFLLIWAELAVGIIGTPFAGS